MTAHHKANRPALPPDIATPPEMQPSADDSAAPLTGVDIIAAYLKTLPNGPGVYRMIDAAGQVLYVGKARSLKKRVQNYTRLGGHTNRIARMIADTASMEFVTTRSEPDALLLEANLIKRLRPRYNVLLRDDKSFAQILLTGDHSAPQITKHRGARTRKGEYFGPFASASAVNRTITTLQRAFLLRSCTDSVYESRTRPCLLFQIKRCAAPCTGEISVQDYGRLVDEARDFLRGRSENVRESLQADMMAASDALEFERAARLRNRLRALAPITHQQGINPEGLEEADVFAAHQDGGHTCVQVFFFRTGQNWGNRAYFPRADKSFEAGAVLEAFIAQFYDEREPPRLILTSHGFEAQDLLAEALSTRAGRKVQVLHPQRGEKREVMAHAIDNAREALGRKLAETSSQARLLEGLAKTFALPAPPRRIEIYDNSHIHGSFAVGAMVVAGAEGFMKAQYRKFNIPADGLAPGDDFAMMREVLRRRFSRLVKSTERGEAAEDNDAPQWPDLMLIDGGKGQLSAATAILADLGITDLAIMGVAKGVDRDAGREHFHRPGHQPMMLEPRDPVLYFIQRLRDEAHRFAISSHRQKRAKAVSANPLDDIAGIGPTRKRALMQYFGSAKAIKKASMADLQAVEGISAAMAKTIFEYFYEQS